MLVVWLDNECYTSGRLVNEVKKVLEENDLDYNNVEVFGAYNNNLGEDYQLVDYGSRDMILVCENGVVHTDEEYIQDWEDEWCS